MQTIEEIEHLESTHILESVRKRPGMYVGPTDDATGLHHLLFWIFDDVLDSARAGFGSRLRVTLMDDGSCMVAHDSPLLRQGEGTVVQRLDTATAKFGDTPDRGRGVRGVDTYLPILRALCSKLAVKVPEGSISYERIYHGLWPAKHVNVFEDLTDDLNEWSSLRFWPDPAVFSHREFDPQMIRSRFREISMVHTGYQLELSVDGANTFETFQSRHGMAELCKMSTEPVLGYFMPKEPFRVTVRQGPLALDVAVQWRHRGPRKIISYANSVHTRRGMHELGLVDALRDANADGSYTACVSVFLPAPRFSSPIKDRLGNPEIREFVREHVGPALRRFLASDPSLAESVAYSRYEPDVETEEGGS